MSKTKGFLVAVAVATMAFTFSCSSDDGEKESGSGGNQFNPNIKYTSFTDSRNGRTYRSVKIGNQTWMAENLNYNTTGSKCYGEGGVVLIGFDDDNFDARDFRNENGYIVDVTEVTEKLSPDKVQGNCTKYGRLYDWKTALKVCPDGWHLPSNAEWEVLTTYAGGDSTAGIKLKATNGWDCYEGANCNGTDDYGFSALPGGSGSSDSTFTFGTVGFYGRWWSSTEYDNNYAYCLYMGYYFNNPYNYNRYYYMFRKYCDKSRLFSVRCLQN